MILAAKQIRPSELEPAGRSRPAAAAGARPWCPPRGALVALCVLLWGCQGNLAEPAGDGPSAQDTGGPVADGPGNARDGRVDGPTPPMDRGHGALDKAHPGADGPGGGADRALPAPDKALPKPDKALPKPDLQPPSPLPGGKPNFVVALGVLQAGKRDNRVRLGTYAFNGGAKTVTAWMYYWTQKKPAGRVGTGTVPNGGCTGGSKPRACEVLAPGGYTKAPNDVRTGSYKLGSSGGKPYVSISWPAAPGKTWTEQWWIASGAGGKLAVLSLKYSNGATHGHGFGSKVPLSTRRSMSTVHATAGPFTYRINTWAHDKLTSSTNKSFSPAQYTRCSKTTWVMTRYQSSSATSCKCPAPYHKDSSLQYYIQMVTSKDRRDTWWHWCTCLAGAKYCYPGNSHVKPLMQIIDDGGAFRGWVGVEASFYPYSKADPREADMLSVIRIY